MQNLRTEVFPDFFEKKLGYSKKMVLIGSCFAENIGKKLVDAKLPALINPFGILYNPATVAQTLGDIIEKKVFTTEDFSFINEKWISFSHHGSFSGTDKDEVLLTINESINTAHDFLANSSVLYLTFGTSLVYELIESGKIVANCHKVPAKQFKHYMLGLDDMTNFIKDILEKVKQLNPKLEVVLTTSPVRHWKDGAFNNQVSKSNLFLMVHWLVNHFDYIHYFPSYELMMDDLRDYRFYDDDMLHPSKLAIEYIWEKFCSTFLSEKAIETAKKIEKLRKNMEHRVFYPQTEAYKKFIDSNLKQIANLKKMHPVINFDKEEKYFISEGKSYFPESY